MHRQRLHAAALDELGELQRVGGVGEALAAEDGRSVATEELGHVLASGLDDLLRHRLALAYDAALEVLFAPPGKVLAEADEEDDEEDEYGERQCEDEDNDSEDK